MTPSQVFSLSRRQQALAAALFSLTLAVTLVPSPASAQAPAYQEMPAPLAETIPPPPSLGQHWVPGHWKWGAKGWRWHAGHYTNKNVPPMPTVMVEPMPPQPSPLHVFVRGHWAWGGAKWVWNPGIWVRR
jgi:hypothetical protein